MLGQQDQGVEHVLAVDLDDLELREEKLCERKGRARDLQPIAELEAVAHLELVDEDVDRSAKRRIHEVELLVPVQRVVLLVRQIPLRDQQLGHLLAVGAPGREVDVAAIA